MTWQDLKNRIEWEGWDYYFSEMASIEELNKLDVALAGLVYDYREAAKRLRYHLEEKFEENGIENY